jgi:hypothetical protein
MKVVLEGEDVLVVLALLRDTIVDNAQELHAREQQDYDTPEEYEIAHMGTVFTISVMASIYSKMFTNMEYPENKQ